MLGIILLVVIVIALLGGLAAGSGATVTGMGTQAWA